MKKEKTAVTSDKLIMLLIIGGILLALIGFVTYNFGHSQGMADKAQQAEDANEGKRDLFHDMQLLWNDFASICIIP